MTWLVLLSMEFVAYEIEENMALTWVALWNLLLMTTAE